MSNGEAAKRTRSMGTIKVEFKNDDGWDSATEAPVCETTNDAEKWIRDNGESGVTYRIIREVAVVTVKVEQVRQASLEFGQ